MDDWFFIISYHYRKQATINDDLTLDDIIPCLLRSVATSNGCVDHKWKLSKTDDVQFYFI